MKLDGKILKKKNSKSSQMLHRIIESLIHFGTGVEIADRPVEQNIEERNKQKCA